ncbi:TPA: fimbrial protein [Enterobacter chuandaensis]|uniref:fimbrial protein n=1 Tax=Enterobacter TaxID=547 RepID=UPI00124AC5B8|nr:fimbrial protein [Enterobacter sp. 168J2]MCP1112882.1 fimbrial protein [Enterobacter bugandensis]HBU6130979.1 fimbrial protein [Enterobacter cloacae]HDR2620851.1 fimbrial protein [Enterobacter chuandaensis]
MTTERVKIISILLMFFWGAAVKAHDGQVNISGTIQDNTCELAPDSQNKMVDMGIVAGAQFSQTGDFTPVKRFILNLQNCGPAASGARVMFSGIADAQNNKLFAIETGEGAASGIALGIYDDSGNIIKPGDMSGATTLKPGQTSAALSFMANYVAKQNTVTPGAANVTVTFSVNYD